MSQEKYKEEYEKYKHIQIEPGIYILKNTLIKYEIQEISTETEKVKLKTLNTNNIQIKTLHWCRKNLIKL